MEIKSPITGSINVVLEREIAASAIIDCYKKELNLDVSCFFKTTDCISVYRCLETGYRFYYPFDVAGDGCFYQELGKFPWYYMDWKWENSIAENFIGKGANILEIGCGGGDFLEKMKKNGASVEGLEMNTVALKECKKKGLAVSDEPVEKFVKGKEEKYDFVCLFQVLEHVIDVRHFMEASLSALKPGGMMAISVPNNDCLIFRSGDIALNMPPHHMGMWNINSLIKMQNHFDMKLEALHVEPLQEYHRGYMRKIVEKEIQKKLRKKIGVFSFLAKSVASRIGFLGASAVSSDIVGHSILAVFKKNDKQ